MKATLATPRLRLRPPRESDVDRLFAMDCDPQVMRWIGDGSVASDRAAYTARVLPRIALHRRRVLGMWVIAVQGGPQFAGVAFLKDLDQSEFVEVGYRLPVAAWGQGYASEAAQRLVAYAFDDVGLASVVGITHPDNLASQRVLRKCGMTRMGVSAFYNRTGLPFFAITERAYRQRHSAA